MSEWVKERGIVSKPSIMMRSRMRGWRRSHGCKELFAGLLTLIAQVDSEYADNKRQQSQQNLFKKESILIQKPKVEI